MPAPRSRSSSSARPSRARRNRLIAAALPGFTTFFQQLDIIITHNEGVFVSLGQTVDNVLLFITGLLSGLTNPNATLKDLTATTLDAGSAYEGLGSGANEASSGIDNATSSTKAQKDALAELQAQTQLQIDAIDIQITKLDDLTAAANDSYDAQKQALQDQLDQQTYVTDSRRRSGEDLVSYERRLERLNTEQKIHALDDAKASFDRTQADKKRALEDERAHLQRTLNEEVNSNKAAQDQMAAANTRPFTAATTAANNYANHALPAAMNAAQIAVLGKAQQMGKDISDIFTDKDGARAKAVVQLGVDIGTGLEAGFEAGFMHALQSGSFGSATDSKGNIDWRKFFGFSQGSDLGSSVSLHGPEVPEGVEIGGSMIWFPWAQHHATGYIGSTEHIAQISEGNQPEAVIPLDNSPRSLALTRAAGLDQLVVQAAGAQTAAPAGAGGPVFNVTMTGPVADELVAARVATRLQREARRKGLLLRAGRG